MCAVQLYKSFIRALVLIEATERAGDNPADLY